MYHRLEILSTWSQMKELGCESLKMSIDILEFRFSASVLIHASCCFQVMLEQMQGMMHLELSGCNDFTEAGLWSSLNARLTSLSVSDCINVADDAIAAISQLLPNLSELSLQAYHVTDTAMAYFTAKQVIS